MKLHSNKFKEQITLMGKEIDSILSYDFNGEVIELGKNELNSVNLSFQTNLLKSAMKELDVDLNVFIPIGTIIKYKFGLKVNDEYEYIDYGNFVVYEVEKNEDTKSYTMKCYDKMLYTMKPYQSIPITYPTTVKNYINAICSVLNINFANQEGTFVNSEREIEKELYLDTEGNDIGYTFRDVLDELAQVTASVICINENDEIEVRYPNNTEDVIDENFLKDINVVFGKKYGPINSIVLSRSAESDNVYLQDEESVLTNGLCEVKIIDNQIMNFDNRSDFLPEILNQLKGLEYYINDFSSTGICYYDVYDYYKVKIEDEEYSCLMLNDSIEITQGLVENIFTEMPDESTTDYTKADKDDRRLNQVSLIVDKQNQTIQGTVKKVNEVSNEFDYVKESTEKSVETINSFILDYEGFKLRLESMEGTINKMNFDFKTDGLSISTPDSETNSRLDNTGVKVYNYKTLTAVFNHKGSGIDKLIGPGTAHLGYLKIAKGTKNGKKVTQIFHLENLTEDLKDLVGDE